MYTEYICIYNIYTYKKRKKRTGKSESKYVRKENKRKEDG